MIETPHPNAAAHTSSRQICDFATLSPASVNVPHAMRQYSFLCEKSKFPGGTSPGKSFASTECDRKIDDSVLFRQQSEIHFEQLRLHWQQQEFPL